MPHEVQVRALLPAWRRAGPVSIVLVGPPLLQMAQIITFIGGGGGGGVGWACPAADGAVHNLYRGFEPVLLPTL